MENDQELGKQLTALEEYSRQQLKYTRLQCLFSLISLVCCVIVVVLVFTALPRVEAMVTQAEDILGNLEVTTRELAGMDVTSLAQQMQSLLTNVDSLVANVDTLVSTSQDGVADTLEKINDIDFDALNKAIKDLSTVIEPLAKFFKTFQ